MTSFNLGPLAIPMQHGLLYLGFFAALFAGWLAGRRRKTNPEGVLFAMLIAVLFLKEPAGPWRWTAAALIGVGMMLLRL